MNTTTASPATELTTRFADQLAALKAQSNLLQVNEDADFFYVHFSPGTLRVVKISEVNPHGGIAIAWTAPGGGSAGDSHYVNIGEAARNMARMKALVDFAWIIGREMGLSIK